MSKEPKQPDPRLFQPIEEVLPPRTFLRIDASGPDYVWIVLSGAEKSYLASRYFVEPARIWSATKLRSCWGDRPLTQAAVEAAFMTRDLLGLGRISKRPPEAE
jgi:hypothetical protein